MTTFDSGSGMATVDGEPGNPVHDFCKDLADYVERSGFTRQQVATRHPKSESQVFAVLRGDVTKPPSFDEMVTPIIRICGADAEELARWRAKHAVLVREHLAYQQRQKRLKQAAPGQAASSAPAGEPGTAPERPSRRRAVTAGALAFVVLLLAAIPAVWFFTRRDDRTPLPPVPACSFGPPAPGGDLLDVKLPPQADTPEFTDPWWINDVQSGLKVVDQRAWSAGVRGGQDREPFDVLVVRSCLPVVAVERYQLSFNARASVDTTIGVRVQEKKAPLYQDSLDEQVSLTTEMKPFFWEFEGAVTTLNTELTFRLGANPDFDIEVTDVRLILVDD